MTKATTAWPVVSSAVPDPKRSLYRESWAVIIDINDYQQWPKLRYGVNDANGIEDVLVARFGFKRDNIWKLLDGEATRERIMTLLGDELADGHKVQREDLLNWTSAIRPSLTLKPTLPCSPPPPAATKSGESCKAFLSRDHRERLAWLFNDER